MQLVNKLIGLILLVASIYFLGKNIIFTTRTSVYWWRDVSAAGSVISIIAGLTSLIFFPRSIGKLSWILVGLGIILVFVSGRVILLPTSLWYFFLALAAMVAGLQLLRVGRLQF